MNLFRPVSRRKKRKLDIFLASLGLLLVWWLIGLAWIAATIDTRRNGLFMQQRIGMNGKTFTLYKIRTMRDDPGVTTTITCARDPRITSLGHLLRRTKVDELPQLWNVLKGDMSFVGPRPDVEGFADSLEGEQRLLLRVRPGITGPATLKYRDEEELLGNAVDPEDFNRNVIWPDKVRINLHYLREWSLAEDLKFIWRTVARHPKGPSWGASHSNGKAPPTRSQKRPTTTSERGKSSGARIDGRARCAPPPPN